MKLGIPKQGVGYRVLDRGQITTNDVVLDPMHNFDIGYLK